ncbi:MAG: hypothetical protein IJC25_06250 [Clostridia bacterium]|nr:hypothetical protein [Clostridia bacterium]
MKKREFLLRLLLCLPAVLFCVWFVLSVQSVGDAQNDRGRQQLEASLRRAATVCYAAEGVYPPDVAYLEAHYGVRIDRDRYTVFYEIFAENLMPDITVVNKQP